MANRASIPTYLPPGVSVRLAVILLVITGLAMAIALLPIAGPSDGDFPLFLQPWMDAIRLRGLASISGEFSEYTPPYIYLLNVASALEPVVGTIIAVKLVNAPFVIALAVGVGRIVVELTDDRDRGTICAVLMFVVPSLMINAFAHGQADSIYGAFMVWFVLFAMRRKPFAAVVMFGLAFAFKQQTLFLAPVLVYMILSRQMRIWHLLMIPVIYVAAMVPAALAGRPWEELFAIYMGQSQLMRELSMNAPNPWWFARVLVDYDTGVWIGLALGAAAAIALILWSLRLQAGAATTLLLAVSCAAILPFVLPKMNPRYFFVAEMLAIALAMTRPGLWLAALFLQVASLVAILAYFTKTSIGPTVGFIPMTFAVCLLVDALVGARAQSSVGLGDGDEGAHTG